MSRRRSFLAFFIASLLATAISGCTSASGPAIYIAVAGADLSTAADQPDSSAFYAGVQLAVDEFNRASGGGAKLQAGLGEWYEPAQTCR